MSVQISYKKQALFFVLLILIFLAAIEIIFRVYDYYYPNCRFLDSEVYDNVDFEIKRQICHDHGKVIWNNDPLYLIPNQHFNTININSDGFRGEELQNNADYRIFVIGGSTTFGAGASSDSHTISGFLQKKLSSQFPQHNIEVINAGISNAYSFSEANLIKNKILSHDPDLLIIYDGWNDLDRVYENYYDTATDVKLLDQIIRFIKRSEYVTPQVLLKLYFNFHHDNVAVASFDSSNMEQKVSLWTETWTDICNLQNEYGFKTIIMLQPILGTGNKPLSSEEQQHFVHFDNESQIYYYQKYADVLPQLQSACTATHDLRNIFDNYSETIYYDSGHVGDFGNEIIADTMYEKIIDVIQSDLTS